MFFKFIFILVFSCKCDAQVIPEIDADRDVCALPSCSSSIQNSTIEKLCAKSEGLSMRGRCCLMLSDNSKIIGLDLSHCNITSLEKMIFEQAPDVIRLNLTFNPFLQVSNDSFHGLKALHTLSLPSTVECPGTRTWFNKSWKAWNRTTLTSQMNVCSIQRSTCQYLESQNYSCPSHSECQDFGPGRFTCSCENGWGGYKCLRLQNGQPTIAIISGSFGAAIGLSVVFWCTERKYVIGR